MDGVVFEFEPHYNKALFLRCTKYPETLLYTCQRRHRHLMLAACFYSNWYEITNRSVRVVGPQDGLLRAEGNGHLLVSTWSRSIGIILQYIRIGPSSRNYISIPSPAADKLNFGILSGFTPLGIPDFKIGDIAEVYATADQLDPARLMSRKIRDVRAYEPKCTFGFSDIIPLTMGMLRVRGSTVTRIPCPTEYAVGLLCYKEVS